MQLAMLICVGPLSLSLSPLRMFVYVCSFIQIDNEQIDRIEVRSSHPRMLPRSAAECQSLARLGLATQTHDYLARARASRRQPLSDCRGARQRPPTAHSEAPVQWWIRTVLGNLHDARNMK